MILGNTTSSKLFHRREICWSFQKIENYQRKVCALILTGMGDDGTRGMAHLHSKGALTIAEAESSCVVFGMPKMAINAGVVRAILTLDEICEVLGNSMKSVEKCPESEHLLNC